MKTEKTRNLSIAEYYHILQKEYLMAEFRRKIYFSKGDKSYYQRVMDGKREKIESISKRNGQLNNIFNNESKKQEIRNELFDNLGRPKFNLTSTDIDNYFSPGNEFSYQGDIWLLDQVNKDGTLTLYSAISQRFEIVNKCDVSRII